MTCIVGLMHGGHVYVGGDSASGRGTIGPGSTKVWKHTDLGGISWVFGASGFARPIQLYRELSDPKKLEINTSRMKREDMLSLLITEVAKERFRISKENGAITTNKDGMLDCGYSLVIGIGAYLFVSSSTGIAYSIGDKWSFCSDGSGAAEAVGAMSILSIMSLEPEDLIQRALEISADWNPDSVRAPFHIVSTKPE